MGTQGDVLGARVAALIIDTILISLVTLLVVGVLSVVGVAGGSEVFGALIGLIVLPITLAIQFGYFIYLEGDRGQTFGKQIMNIVVVRDDGSDIDMRDAAIRNLLRIVDGLGIVIPYLVALVLVLVTDDNQRLGDIVADTLVVKTE
jgi:uncharacterized RDD family membrane protein YckC